MKKRRSMVQVVPGKDVTLYIPADTPPEVITYLNRLKAEGNFSQGVMEILIRHIVPYRPEAEVSPFERKALLDGIESDLNVGSVERPEENYPSNVQQDRPRAFSPEDIIRQATRNAGKFLNEERNHY